MPKQIRLRIFIDFSIEDKKYIDDFLKHFHLIEREFELDIFTVNDVKVGSLVEESVKQYIEEADIVFAMLSADYFSNSYDIRLKKYLTILDEKVCPILVRSCSWKNSIFKNHQILPIDRVPISLQGNTDAVYSLIIKEIVTVLNSKKQQKGLGNTSQVIWSGVDINNLNPHDSYLPVLKKYEQATKKIFAFTFPFTESFIKKVLKDSVDFWGWVVETSLIKKNEDNTFSLTIDSSSKLLKMFVLNKWELMELAHESITIYKKEVITAEDIVNILKITTNYYRIPKHKTVEDDLIQIFNAFPFKKFPQLLSLLSIIDEISTLIPSFSIPEIEKAKAYVQLSHAYRRLEKLDTAKKYGKLSLKINKKYPQEKEENIADSYETLGSIYLYAGNNEKSILYYTKELEIKEKLLGRYDLELARLYMRMANPYIYTKDHEEAIELLEKSLKICGFQIDRKEAKPLLATINHNLSHVYMEKGDYKEATKYGIKAKSDRENFYGINHPLTGETYEVIASIHYHQGDFGEALSFYKKIADIRATSLGAKHPRIIDAKHGIATCYKGLKEYKKALELYEEVIELCREVLDDTDVNNSHFAIYLDEIGKLYILLKEYQKASHYLEVALSIKEKCHPKGSVNIAYSMDDIGYVDQLKGNLDTAMQKYQKALSIKKKNGMELHPHTPITFQRMGEIFLRREQYDEALSHFRKALHIRTIRLDKTHIDIAKSYYFIAKTQRLKKDYSKAILAEKKALEIYHQGNDKDGIIMCYVYCIHNIVKAKAHKEKEFTDLLCDFFGYVSLNPDVWSKVITTFKKEKTFNQTVAKEILQVIQDKKEFIELMEKLEVSTFVKIEHTVKEYDINEDDIATVGKTRKEIESIINQFLTGESKNK